MKRAILTFVFVAFGTALGATSPEETLVRSVYARLAFAVELEAVHAAVAVPGARIPGSRQQAALANPDLDGSLIAFTIRNVTAGNFAEVENRPAIELVAPPSGYVLDLTPSHHGYIEGDAKLESSIDGVVASWRAVGPYRGNWSGALGRLLGLDEPGRLYNRYAHFTVTASYKGRTETYQALFLFEPSTDGVHGVRIVDPVISVSGLLWVLDAKLFPSAFTSGPHRQVPFVRDWLSRGSKTTCEYSTADGVCCDLNALRCGVRPGLINLYAPSVSAESPRVAALAVNPTPMASCASGCGTVPTINPVSSQDSDTQDHASGSHGATYVVGGWCTQDTTSPPCKWDCNGSASVGAWENGITVMSWHQAVQQTSSINVLNQSPGVSCGGGVSYGVAFCPNLPCGSSLSVNWNGSGFTFGSTVPVGSAIVWSSTKQVVFTCP
jgi:hypothetical protein